MQTQLISIESARIGVNAGCYIVTERFWRGVHNTAADTVLLFPPDWEDDAQPILIQMDDAMPTGIRVDWREWSVGEQLGCNAQFVLSLTEYPWHGVSEG